MHRYIHTELQIDFYCVACKVVPRAMRVPMDSLRFARFESAQSVAATATAMYLSIYVSAAMCIYVCSCRRRVAEFECFFD